MSRSVHVRAAACLALLALALGACSGPSAAERCQPLPLAPGAQGGLDAARAALDFAPVLPCGNPWTMEVTAVTLDHPAGAPRATFIVEAGGPLFFLSQSRAIRQTTNMTLGASRITWEVAGTTARGFEAPAGAWPAVLYVVWEVDQVIHEFQANPSSRYPMPVARDLARANIALSVEARRDSSLSASTTESHLDRPQD